MAKPKKKRVRAEFRKNRTSRARRSGWTRDFQTDSGDQENAARDERISGKGELTRKRTVRGATDDSEQGFGVRLDVDESVCLPGRVLAVHGLTSVVEAANGTTYRCAVRRILKTLSTDERHVVAAGDRVLFRPADKNSSAADREGVIERIEPRRGILSRGRRGRRHVLVANVDQLLIVSSAAEPYLKPNLIDRFLVSAEQGGLRPCICINKVDLVDPASLQPLVGTYSQMGYRVLLLSASTGFGIDRLRKVLIGRQSVVSGQSGVGKSSLLNAVQPGLGLAVAEVSAESQKGRHTTTTARLLPLAGGGHVVDTPGIRQFQLWDIAHEEVAGLYRDLRPFGNRCDFPDCTHTHEAGCAVKHAVADGWLDARRYESYCQLFAGDLE
ncbi:MAG TPA: ribosome small subunit-dependent GTPase A [Pirellulales bacterium]|nr:ribosome small subunit-dependent GTPase A [Pirellulales bacterium]